MKSGLEGRNNHVPGLPKPQGSKRLNEVRPRRPEQWLAQAVHDVAVETVSMKSGLEGRNNTVIFPMNYMRRDLSQ